MCRAVPAQVVRVESDIAWVEQNGQEIPVSLLGVGSVNVGEYVYHHAGLALERLDAETAALILSVLDELDVILKMADE
jgi:hydrogenase expression/formation protein HypC